MSHLLIKPKGTKMHRFIKIVPSANLAVSLSSEHSLHKIPRRIVATVGRNVYINNEPTMNLCGRQPHIRYLEKSDNFNAAFKNVEKYRRASETRLKEIKFQEQEAAEDKQKDKQTNKQTPDLVANKNVVNPRTAECRVVDMLCFDYLLDMKKRNCQTVAHPNILNLMGKKKTVKYIVVSAYKKGEEPELNFRGTYWNKINTGLETNGASGQQFAMLSPKRSYSTTTRAIKGERLSMDKINDDQMLSNLTQSCFKKYLTLSIRRKASKVSKSSNLELNSNFPLSTFFNSENRLMNIDVYKQSLIEAAKRRAALNKYKPAGVKYKNEVVASPRVENNEESSKNRLKNDIDFQSKADDVRKKVDDDHDVDSQESVENRLKFNPLKNCLGHINRPTNSYPLPMELKKLAEKSNVVSSRVVNDEECSKNRFQKDIDFQSKSDDVRKNVDDDNTDGSQAYVVNRLKFKALRNYLGHIRKLINSYPLSMELKKPAESSNVFSPKVVNNEESSKNHFKKDIDFQSKADDVRKKYDDYNNAGSQANVVKCLKFSPLKNYSLPMILKKPAENGKVVSPKVMNNEESSKNRSKKDINFQSKADDVRKNVGDDNNAGSQANVVKTLKFSPLPMILKKAAENSNEGRNLKSLVIRQPKLMETDKPTSHGQKEDHVQKPQLKPICLNLESSEQANNDGVGFRSNFSIVNLLRKLATKNVSPDKVVEYTLIEPRFEFYFIGLSPATLKSRSSNDSIELYSRKHMFSLRLPTISMGYIPPKVDFKYIVKSQLKPLCHYSSVGKNKDTDGFVPNFKTNLEKRHKIDSNQSCITAKRDVQHETESPNQSVCYSLVFKKPKEKNDTKTELSVVGYISPKNCAAHILIPPKKSSLLPMKLENSGHRNDVDRKLKMSVASKSELVKSSSSNKNLDQVKATSHNLECLKQAEVGDKSLPYRTKLKGCTPPMGFEKKDYIRIPGRNCKNCESRENPVIYAEGYIPFDEAPKSQLEPSSLYQQPGKFNTRIDDDEFKLNSKNSKNSKPQVAIFERDMLAKTDLKHASGPGYKPLCPHLLPEKPKQPTDKNKIRETSVSDTGNRSPIKFCNTSIHRKNNTGTPATFKYKCTLCPPLLKPKKQVDDNSAIKNPKNDHVPKRKMSSLKGFTPKKNVNYKLKTCSCAPPSRCLRQSSSCILELNPEHRGISRPQVNIFRGFNTKGKSEIDFKYVSSYRPQVTIFAKRHPTINSDEETICVIDEKQFDIDRKE